MMRCIGMSRVSAGLVAIMSLWLIFGSPLRAADNTQAFLDGLRQRNLHDIALQFLQALRDNTKTSKAVRETLDYQFGVTLIGGAGNLPLEKQEKQLDEAREYLEKFLSDHPQHSLADSANRYLVDLKIKSGESMLDEARQPGKISDERERWLERARAKFQEAQKSLQEIDSRLIKKKKRLNKLVLNTPSLIAQQDRLVAEMLLTRLSLCKTYYDLAQTYPKGGKENKTYLREAVDKYSYYYWKYNRWLGGLAFRLQQALCHKELGEYERALEILEALSIPNTGEDDSYRQIRAAATRMAMEIDLLPKLKKYKEAWELYETWQASLHQPGRTDFLVPEISCLGGEAALELCRQLGENDPQQAQLRNTMRNRARQLLSLAARRPGAYQLKAKLKLGDPLLVSEQTQVKPPQSYEEARDRATVAWNQTLRSDLKPEQVERVRGEALECLRYALNHPSAEAKAEEVNTLRFRLAYLDWLVGDYYAAAVLGDFLARRCTDLPEGLKGAKIALLAYAGIVENLPSGTDHSFGMERIEELARFAAEHWPKEDLASYAWFALIRIADKDGDSERALELLQRIPADSDYRGEAELTVGHLLWRSYRQAARLPKQKQPTTAKMNEMLSQARKMLTLGIERLRKESSGDAPSYSLAVGTLSLAKICLEQHEAERAVQWLDDPKIGAHTLAKSDNQAADRGTFREDVFKTALQAYVATEQTKKAAQAMDALEKAAPEKNLTDIYIALGHELEKSLKRLHAENKQAEAAKVARGFELFLSRIANRPANQITFNVLYWVAEQFVELGDSLPTTDGKLSPEADNYYRKAALAYDRIVNICREDKEFAPREGTVEAIQIKLARCLRRLGKYKTALDMLAAVLSINNNLLDAQREAAYAYQDWGRDKPGYYELAIRGGKKARTKSGDVVKLVWGWLGIAKMVQFNDKYQDIFYEARYNTALCRLQYALSLDGKKQTTQLRLAEQDILMVQRLRPEMGGEKWYEKFDALLIRIQTKIGINENNRGLKAAEKKFSAD